MEENVYCDDHFISSGYLRDPLEIIKKVLLTFSSKNTFKLLLKNLSICLGDNLERLKQNPQEILTRYSACCITLGREVKIESGNESFLAKAVSVSSQGELICQTENGQQKVRAGEVSVRGLLGYIK